MDWLENELKELGKGQWSPEALVGVMIDNFMSYNDLKNLRQAFSLKYDKDMDRFMHPIWQVSPFEKLFVRPRVVIRWLSLYRRSSRSVRYTRSSRTI